MCVTNPHPHVEWSHNVSHQDRHKITSAVEVLKDLFHQFVPSDEEFQPRHGNASVSASTMVITALMAFGFTCGQNLTERFKTAIDAAENILPAHAKRFTTRQGLFKALLTGGEQLLLHVRSLLVQRLRRHNAWLMHGRPTFAVDGSRFLLPRTKANQAYFAAASRKEAMTYKKKQDLAKAATTQCNVSLCFHLGNALPFCWTAADSSQGERSLLLQMLGHLPESSRLVMDAFYFGREFWNHLIDAGHTFIVRAGSNLELNQVLTNLGGKIRRRDGLVLYWPENAIQRGEGPMLLLCVEVTVGRKRMFLVTNELSLTESVLAELYGRRWGIEVFFRTVKQSWQRTKLQSRTAANALVEMNWTLLGVWISLSHAQRITKLCHRLSPVRVLRTIARLVGDVARQSRLPWDLKGTLRLCQIADESGRTSSKESRSYPRKKKQKPTGEPFLRPACKSLIKLARDFFARKSLPA